MCKVIGFHFEKIENQLRNQSLNSTLNKIQNLILQIKKPLDQNNSKFEKLAQEV
jgi:hypothetical protein